MEKENKIMGRPLEYSQDILNKTEEYLDSCIDTIEDYTKTSGDKSASFERIVNVNLPSIEGLAVHLRVARSTIYDWKSKYKDFSDILEDLLAEQAKRLLSNGLSGNYNSTIAKLILTKHGYTDKVEQDVTSGGEKLPTVINIVKPE